MIPDIDQDVDAKSRKLFRAELEVKSGLQMHKREMKLHSTR